MGSRIQQVIEKYSKFENILPEELSDINFGDLEIAAEEIKNIMDEDLEMIRNLSYRKNVTIDIDRFRKADHVIQLGFFRQGDNEQQETQFYLSHWYMSMVTLGILSKNIIVLSPELVKYHIKYSKTDSTKFERKTNFNYFVRTWQDFYGYLINIRQTIYDYYDLFIRTCKKIDPENKETPYYAYKSDTWPGDLHAAVKELLLHGNRGRLAGFALLRSMIEVQVIRELFDLKKSQKYKNKTITFKNKFIPTINAICKCIDRLNRGELFKTDILMRIYDWSSIVSHRGFRTDEYVTWFVYSIAAQLCNLFNMNIQKHRDEVLLELIRTAQIEIKDTTTST